MEKLFIHKLHEEVSLKRKVSGTFFIVLWRLKMMALCVIKRLLRHFTELSTLYSQSLVISKLFVKLQKLLCWKNVEFSDAMQKAFN